MPWKIAEKIFHAMEKLARKFPCDGKIFAEISMPWKNFGKNFHGMEKSAPAGRPTDSPRA